MRIFGVIPFIKLKKRQLNSEKRRKMRRRANPLIFWGGELCPVFLRFLFQIFYVLAHFSAWKRDKCTYSSSEEVSDYVMFLEFPIRRNWVTSRPTITHLNIHCKRSGLRVQFPIRSAQFAVTDVHLFIVPASLYSFLLTFGQSRCFPFSL